MSGLKVQQSSTSMMSWEVETSQGGVRMVYSICYEHGSYFPVHFAEFSDGPREGAKRIGHATNNPHVDCHKQRLGVEFCFGK